MPEGGYFSTLLFVTGINVTPYSWVKYRLQAISNRLCLFCWTVTCANRYSHEAIPVVLILTPATNNFQSIFGSKRTAEENSFCARVLHVCFFFFPFPLSSSTSPTSDANYHGLCLLDRRCVLMIILESWSQTAELPVWPSKSPEKRHFYYPAKVFVPRTVGYYLWDYFFPIAKY